MGCLRVSDLGERGLVERLLGFLSPGPSPLPPWEDASAFSLGDGRCVVVNTECPRG